MLRYTLKILLEFKGGIEMPNWLTVVVGALASATPQVLHIVPYPWSIIATAVIAGITGAYHLMQQPPQ